MDAVVHFDGLEAVSPQGKDTAYACGLRGPGWYWWDETWANATGPFDTREEAQADLDLYCRYVLHHRKGA